MRYIDTHCHWYDEAFSAQDASEAIGRSLRAGVCKMLQADVDSRERDRMFELCAEYPDCLVPMLGLYPGSVNAGWKDELDKLCAHDRTGVIAVGEIGLDYHSGTGFAKEQKEALRIQLELASEWGLPVNIHLRDASEDFLTVIEDCTHLQLRGNLHAFGGSAEFFKRVARTGDWYVGIGGVVTFKNAGIARELARIPSDRILFETDTPYLTPTPHRGERNESSYIPLIAAKVAEIKGLDLETLSEIVFANTLRLFGNSLTR